MIDYTYYNSNLSECCLRINIYDERNPQHSTKKQNLCPVLIFNTEHDRPVLSNCFCAVLDEELHEISETVPRPWPKPRKKPDPSGIIGKSI